MGFSKKMLLSSIRRWWYGGTQTLSLLVAKALLAQRWAFGARCGERTMLGDGEECWVDRTCCGNPVPQVFFPPLHFVTQGGYQGAEPEVSLTAFVLIALQEARAVCKDHVNVSQPHMGRGRGWVDNWYVSQRKTVLQDEVPNPYSSHLRSQIYRPFCPELGREHHQSRRIPCPEVPVAEPTLHGGPVLLRLGPDRKTQKRESSHEVFQR